MNKKALVFLILFLLTGCYDHKELTSISIMTATEINKVDNEYIISAQLVNPQSKDTVNVQAPFIIYEGKGKTIQEAYRQIKLQSSRYLYPNHLQILIINEKLAKEALESLGFKAKQIEEAFNKINNQDLTLEDYIKEALKIM